MPNDGIEQRLERLGEAVVLADVSDMRALAELHTLFQEFSLVAAEAGWTQPAAAAKAAADLVERIILSDVSDPQASLKVVSQTVSAVQSIINEGNNQAAANFPAELGLCPPPDESVDLSSVQFPDLPANVDEAIFSDFLSRQGPVLDEMEQLILGLEQPNSADRLAELRRRIHTLKGDSALLGLTDVERLCHATEDILSNNEPKGMVDFLLGVKDWLGRAFDSYAGRGLPPGPIDELLADAPGRASTDPTAASDGPVAQPEVQEKTAPEPVLLEADPELLISFVSEANDHLDAANVHLLALETEPADAEAMNAVFRAFHTIKGVAGFLALSDIGELAHEAENLLDRARKGDVVLSGSAMDVVFDAVDTLKRLVENVKHSLSAGEPLVTEQSLPELLHRIKEAAVGKGPPAEEPAMDNSASGRKIGEILVDAGVVTEEAIEASLEQQSSAPGRKKLGEILVDSAMASRKSVQSALAAQHAHPENKLGELMVASGTVAPQDLDAALAKQQEPPAKPKIGEILVRDGRASAKDVARALRSQKAAQASGAVRVRETLKVDADRLDKLVDAIGELVIAESMVHQSMELAIAESPELARRLGQLKKITRELQGMGMSLRMVPVRGTFQKMARLVRDLARKSGKLVNFSMSGEDTELDKTVVDQIGDPLVHMIRNAVDHGIEDTPHERRNAGKPEAGRITLRAFHRGGSIYIEVEDDGRGLDREAILAKARERHLVRDGDSMTDREVFNLIFEPGFSTASKVTDVSGRGVGMDVVRRNIEALRGHTEIRSELGKGSVFSIRLPLTLAIIDGMVVEVGRERYIIPTLSVVMSLRPDPRDMSTVLNRGKMLKVHGNLVPVFSLHDLFGVERAEGAVDRELVVIIEDNGRQAGLLVDDLLGQQQIVIKSLGQGMRNIPGIAGAAIMPDGRVGLILDVGGIVRLVTAAREGEPAAHLVDERNARNVQ